jgi:prevent-host-death family protein
MYVKATDLKNKLGEYLEKCRSEDVIITRHGREYAVLNAIRDESVVSEKNTAYNYNDTKSSIGKMTYREFKKFTANTEERYELIDGHVYLLASPKVYHQHASSRIYVELFNWFDGRKCIPYYAPFDITLNLQKNDPDVVQPDIIVICDLKEKMDDSGYYMGIPSLAVEILSSSTKSKDMITKLNLYMCSGVKEYWIVDPDIREVSIYLFEDCNIKAHKTFLSDMTCKSFLFDSLELKLDRVFM